jgi:hypothetical protein
VPEQQNRNKLYASNENLDPGPTSEVSMGLSFLPYNSTLKANKKAVSVNRYRFFIIKLFSLQA